MKPSTKPAPPPKTAEVLDAELRRTWHTATHDALFRALIPKKLEAPK